MKHWFTIPFLDADGFGTPDVQGWARSHGWYVESYEWHESRLLGRRDKQELRVKLLPAPGVFPNSGAQITASSGATLVYDDVERIMGVTLRPEFHDVASLQPEDAEPELSAVAQSYRRLADKDGYLDGIAKIVNFITGELVTLPTPARVHLRDLDEFIAGHQRQFAEEWNAAHPDKPVKP